MARSDLAAHWQHVYASKAPDAVSWFRPHLDLSLELLERAGLKPDSRIIDVGAGASTLVDDLLTRGVRSITALDISEAALRISRERLGTLSESVTWIVSDVTSAEFPAGCFDIWHDRATLHFLTDNRAIEAYVDVASHAVAPNGFAVVSGFAATGPRRCSGLPVVRRDAHELTGLFSDHFDPVEERHEDHVTPGGLSQRFTYVLMRRRG